MDEIPSTGEAQPSAGSGAGIAGSPTDDGGDPPSDEDTEQDEAENGLTIGFGL